MLSHSSTTGNELIKYAKKNNIPLRRVCFKDKLNDEIPCHGGYIINMADSTEHGTHWIALYLAKYGKHCQAIYFDSFGKEPPIDIMTFCKRYGVIELLVNNNQIQSINSGFCGQYCLDFLYFMTHQKGSLKERFYKFTNVYIQGDIQQE
jgi:hypothetical protein